MTDLPNPSAVEVTWEAALGRRVVLVKARLWYDAREAARALLGGEPEYVTAVIPGYVGYCPDFDDPITPWPNRGSAPLRATMRVLVFTGRCATRND